MEPFAEIVGLLNPRATGAKLIEGAGRWSVRYSRVDYAGFGVVLAGGCWLVVDGQAPLRLETGDFVLMPAVPGFVIGSDLDVEPVAVDAAEAAARTALSTRHGEAAGEATFKQLGGYFRLEPANAALLTGLLPRLVHIQAADPAAGRMARLIRLISEEALGDQPGRELMLDRLVEVLLVEALRFRPETLSPVARHGLLEGLADPRLGGALRRLHADVARPWTVAELAREAGLSRSAFSARFTETLGTSPLQYLINWRMALAKDMLQRGGAPLETVATAIGYQSASAFSTAFRRHAGRPPSDFARAMAA